MTDLNQLTLENLQHNVETNAFDSSVVNIRLLNWKDDSTFPAEPVDILIGADLVYDKNILELFVYAVTRLLREGMLASLCVFVLT